MKKKFFLIEWSLVFSLMVLVHVGAICQTQDEIYTVMSIIHKESKRKNQAIKTVKSIQSSRDSEIEIVLYGMFLFYKSFLSSQDINSCNFHPSCSEYCLHSFKKKGFVKGGLMTFDRLVRCNPISLENYPFDKSKNKFLDPVDE